MATATGRAECVTCGKEKSAVRCEGCLQIFCRNHLNDHCQELSQQLDEIEVHRDVFRQTLTVQTTDSQKHPFIKQINQWEQDSIRKVQQTAQECRQLLLHHTTKHINQIEIDLGKLTDQLRQTRKENDFNETDLNYFKQKLSQLAKQLDRPPNISIQQDSTTLINKLSVVISKEQFISSSHIDFTTKWTQNAVTVAGGNGRGNRFNQLSHSEGIYVDDDDQCIYIADHDNHRIVKWKYDAKDGEVVAGGNGQGNRNDQLNGPTDVVVDERNDSLIICDYQNKRVVRWPRRNGTNGQTIISDIKCCCLTMDDNGDLYVSDRIKHEVRRWKIGDTNGAILAGGNGKGNHFNQLNVPTGIFIDQDYSVYVSDRENHRVMKWVRGAKEGIVVAGGQGQGNGLTQLFRPAGLIVDQLGRVYVADSENHRIMRWSKGYKEGSIVIRGDGKGQQPNQFNLPTALSFDRQGNLYVGDYDNNRILKFHVDSN